MMRGRYASRSTFLLSRVTEPLVTDFVPCVRPQGILRHDGPWSSGTSSWMIAPFGRLETAMRPSS
jgi:hypothetical protein